jgi:Holliday junction resolvase RusA-like endonuclease
MNDEITFQVYGKPKGQQRHRTYTRGKDGRPLPFAREVDPSTQDKNNLRAQAIRWRPASPWAGPVALTIVWYMPRPKSQYRSGKHAGELRDGAPNYCGH